MKQEAIAARKPGLFQCTVGLVGFGDTAQATARRILNGERPTNVVNGI